jgi:WD40 repeat protein
MLIGLDPLPGRSTARGVTGCQVGANQEHTAPVKAVAFSPDGTRVVTGSGDNAARLWDEATGKVLATLAGHVDSVWAVAFSPEGTRVLTGSEDSTARLWYVSKSAQDLINIVRTSVPGA